MNWRARTTEDNQKLFGETYRGLCQKLVNLKDGKSRIIEYQDSSDSWISIEEIQVSTDTGEIAVVRSTHQPVSV